MSESQEDHALLSSWAGLKATVRPCMWCQQSHNSSHSVPLVLLFLWCLLWSCTGQLHCWISKGSVLSPFCSWVTIESQRFQISVRSLEAATHLPLSSCKAAMERGYSSSPIVLRPLWSQLPLPGSERHCYFSCLTSACEDSRQYRYLLDPDWLSWRNWLFLPSAAAALLRGSNWSVGHRARSLGSDQRLSFPG